MYIFTVCYHGFALIGLLSQVGALGSSVISNLSSWDSDMFYLNSRKGTECQKLESATGTVAEIRNKNFKAVISARHCYISFKFPSETFRLKQESKFTDPVKLCWLNPMLKFLSHCVT